MIRARFNLKQVLRTTKVTVMPAEMSSLNRHRERVCYCRKTLIEVGNSHGAGHLQLVLMLITGTVGNSSFIFADVVKAVSKIIIARPDLIKCPSFMDDFNKMDIGAMRSYARLSPIGLPVSSVLMVMMLAQLCDETKRILCSE